MDKLLALRMFVETVDAKGFSSAARRLGLATSSVTRMMDGLEAELGAVLLNRSTRQVTVSEAGAAYYANARRILDAVEDADAQVADRGEEAAGHLRVSAPVAFGQRCIAPHLGTLLARFPKLELDLTLTDEIVDLLGERIDLSIRLGSPSAMDDIVSREVGRFRRRVVASPSHLARHGMPSSPAALADHECLRFTYGAGDQVWSFCQVDTNGGEKGEPLKVPVNGKFRSNSAEVLREVAIADGGIALLPDWLVDDDIAGGRLTLLFDGYVINPNRASSAISALYLPNHRGSRRVNTFIDFLSALPGVAAASG